jgi:hypothetical protein
VYEFKEGDLVRVHSLVKAFHWNGFIRVVRGRVGNEQVRVDKEKVRWRVGVVGCLNLNEDMNVKAANLSLIIPVSN